MRTSAPRCFPRLNNAVFCPDNIGKRPVTASSWPDCDVFSLRKQGAEQDTHIPPRSSQSCAACKCLGWASTISIAILGRGNRLVRLAPSAPHFANCNWRCPTTSGIAPLATLRTAPSLLDVSMVECAGSGILQKATLTLFAQSETLIPDFDDVAGVEHPAEDQRRLRPPSVMIA